MGKRRPHSPGSSLGGGVKEEWDRVFPPAPPTLYVWPGRLAGGCEPHPNPPQPSKIQRRKEKNEVSEDED